MKHRSYSISILKQWFWDFGVYQNPHKSCCQLPVSGLLWQGLVGGEEVEIIYIFNKFPKDADHTLNITSHNPYHSH